MTKKSWLFFGVCAAAGAVTAFRRRATDVRVQTEREISNCERALQQLGAKISGLQS